MTNPLISKRHYRDDIRLSIIGLGGMLLVNMGRSAVSRIVSDSKTERVMNFHASSRVL